MGLLSVFVHLQRSSKQQRLWCPLQRRECHSATLYKDGFSDDPRSTALRVRSINALASCVAVGQPTISALLLPWLRVSPGLRI